VRRRPLRIAILGTRGIPAGYGGFETFAEQLSVRLAARGHAVTVYGRKRYIRHDGPDYRGVRVRLLPTVMHKYLDTPVHTLLSTLHVLFRRQDVLLYCNSANAFCTGLPRLFGMRVALNVDGLEWQRAKWNAFGRAVYRLSEWLSTLLPHRVVTDARVVEAYYLRRFGAPSTYIPYGTPVGRVARADAPRRWGAAPRRYLLYVSRLEPENNALAVVRAFERVRTDLRLLVVGDAPFSTAYIRELRSTRDPRIVFTGYVFGEGYRELQSHAYLYIQATEVGGTHPALLEAMGHGNCVVANDVPEHREVLGDAGVYFDVKKPGSLEAALARLLADPAAAERYRRAAARRAAERYSWERVTDDYERLLVRLGRMG
jgi:glycosyltransferase involved in cell wall biosynthesis